uniref:Uncharacterized protein n=1 Tax=Rhizophora mucronata TaxID=61149 RepID=A0A2P2QTP6_RHIMU
MRWLPSDNFNFYYLQVCKPLFFRWSHRHRFLRSLM